MENIIFQLPYDAYEKEITENKAFAGDSEAKGVNSCREGAPTGRYFKKKNINILKRGYRCRTENHSIRFKFGSEMKRSFVIPGLMATNVMGQMCMDMVPQGITFYNGYYFISAYCKAHEHNSIIYVVDEATKEYITTLVLKGKPHAGGITFAGGRLWVCGTSRMYHYGYDAVEEAVEKARKDENIKSVDISGSAVEIKLTAGEKASFITTYKGYLCVGAYEQDEKIGGKVRFYKPLPEENGELKCLAAADIPSKAQGIDFLVKKNEEYMVITSSFGITRSKLYIYKRAEDGAFRKIKKITFPRMLEEVVVRDDYTYCVFESCAKKYRIPMMSVIGEVCGFKNDFIFR